MKPLRSKHGTSLVMTAALLVVLAMVAMAAVGLVTLLGGGQQMQRATDSGNLSVAHALLTQVAVGLPQQGDQQQYNGVTDPSATNPNGVVNLRNINRLSAQTMLVQYNAAQINAQGLDAGANTHATNISKMMSEISRGLQQQLSSSSATQSFFTPVAQLNPVGQFGNKAILPTGTTQTSYVDRGMSSNIYMLPQQIADYSFTSNSSQLYTKTLASNIQSVSSDPAHGNYINGYVDGLSPNPLQYSQSYFVPLRPGAKSHLITSTAFTTQNKTSSNPKSFDWGTAAVANGYSVTSVSTDKQGANANFQAYAQVQPIDPVGFAAAIPHGFIRILNGAASPTSGFGAGNTDAFVFVMNDNQVYPNGANGALPYFVGQSDTGLPYNATNGVDYITKIAAAIAAGQTPDCSGLSVGYQLSGDQLGLGGVSQTNCNTITGVGNDGVGSDPQPINNINLDDPSNAVNTAMHQYNNNDPRSLWARPLIQAAYNIQPPQPTGSNNQSVNVADIVNLQLLSARSEGGDFTPTTYQSGMAAVPAAGRAALPSPLFRISNDKGAMLASTINGTINKQGMKKGGTMWNFLTQRMYEIDPNWTTYTTDLDSILTQAYVPMGGRGYIYYSQTGNNNQGGLVLKSESDALADAKWLSTFIAQPVDAHSPSNPSELTTWPLVNDSMIDVAGDWGFEHPYDLEGQICVSNWYSFTPASGYNNLLGQVDLGAFNNNCCSAASNQKTSSFSINYGASGDTVTLPSTCPCSAGGCGYGGPC